MAKTSGNNEIDVQHKSSASTAKNEQELEAYRQRLFAAKEAFRKEQAKLPFEKKIEIVMKLNRFAREWRFEGEHAQKR